MNRIEPLAEPQPMPRILIVDDDTAGCRTLQLHLQAQGHRAAVTHNLDEGLASALNEPPDLCPSSTTTAPQRPLTEMSLADVELAHGQRILDATGWHRGRACEILGVSRPRLRRLIRDYGLNSATGVESEQED